MILAEDEVELGTDHSGIMVLPEAEPGRRPRVVPPSRRIGSHAGWRSRSRRTCCRRRFPSEHEHRVLVDVDPDDRVVRRAVVPQRRRGAVAVDALRRRGHEVVDNRQGRRCANRLGHAHEAGERHDLARAGFVGGDAIPLGSRILFVADAYDAMTSDRIYRSRLSHERAISELERCAGTQFDPTVVQVFLEGLERTELLALKQA
jgi:hypothetical protein